MAENPALKAQNELRAILEQVSQAASSFSSDPSLERMSWLGEILASLEHPMRDIEFADDDERSMELVRTLEIHGTGWLPFGTPGRKFEKGDLLLTHDRSIAFVTAVRETGEIDQIAGSPNSKTIAKGDFALTWRPAKDARQWLKNTQQPASGYSDLNASLNYLVRQWGNKQSDNGADITSVVGFFREILSSPGLKLPHGDLEEFSAVSDIVAYCNNHGAGLQPFAPGNTALPGDIVSLNKPKTFALITRVSERDTFDILVGGAASAAPLREPKNSILLLRAIPSGNIEQFWKPARPRGSRPK
jgi:hypothetical protein